METHVWSDDCQKQVQQFINNRAQHFVVRWLQPFFFLTYYFLEFLFHFLFLGDI
jgi:hypothetical protein